MRTFFLVSTLLFLACLSVHASLSANQNFTSYMTGLFGYYNITKIESLIDCYKNQEAQFFQWLNLFYHAEVSQVAGRSADCLADIANENMIIVQTWHSMSCAIGTTAFKNLRKELGLSADFEKATPFYNTLRWYSSAYPIQIVSYMQESMSLISQGQFSAAGAALAPQLKPWAADIASKSNLYLNTISFYNGIFLARNWGIPTEIPNCIYPKDNSSQNILNFYTGWANVSKHMLLNPAQALNQTQIYFNGTGQTLYSQTNSSIYSCINQTANGTLIRNTYGFGLDPYDPALMNTLVTFLNENTTNQRNYSTVLYSMYEAVLSQNYLVVGTRFGSLMNLISKKNGEEPEPKFLEII